MNSWVESGMQDESQLQAAGSRRVGDGRNIGAMPGGQWHVSELPRSNLPEAVQLCADAMRNNPLHTHVFGKHPVTCDKRSRVFLGASMRYIHRRGHLYGIYFRTSLVGVVGVLPPGACRPRMFDALRLLSALRAGGSPKGVWRVVRW